MRFSLLQVKLNSEIGQQVKDLMISLKQLIRLCDQLKVTSKQSIVEKGINMPISRVGVSQTKSS